MKQYLSALAVLGILAAARLGFAQASNDAVAEHYEKSFAAESTGDFARALNEILEVLRSQPQDYVAMLRASWLYYSKGQHEDAIIAYRKASALSPRSLEARLGLMLPMMAMGRWKETIDLCREVLKIAPGNYLALSRLAFSQFNLGAFAEAKKIYEKVLDLYPSELEMQLGLGWTELKLGQKAAARKIFQRVLEIRRTNLSARSGLEACGS